MLDMTVVCLVQLGWKFLLGMAFLLAQQGGMLCHQQGSSMCSLLCEHVVYIASKQSKQA